MEKLKLVSYVFMIIFTLITIATSIFLIISGNYIIPIFITLILIFTMLILIFAWLILYTQRKSDEYGNN